MSFAAFALFASFLGPSTAPAEPSRHVVLVSIDGMRGDYLWDEATYHLKIPNLRKLLAEGSYAEGALSVTPSLTYPSHAAIATGMYPARHGVLANELFQPERWRGEEDGYDSQDWYWEASYLKATTLWDAARARGLKTAAFQWPSTVGASIDWLYVSRPRGYQTDVSTPALLSRFESEVGKLPGADGRLRDHYLALMASRVLREERPHLLLIHFGLADSQQHEHGAASPEGLAAVESVDQNLGLLMDAVEEAGIGDATTFVVTGDHGHLPLHTQIGANIPLVEAGLLELDAEGRISSWSAIASSARPVAFVYLRDPSLEPRVEAIFLALSRRHGGIFRLLSRAELDRLGADPVARFALEAAVGYTFDDRLAGPLLTSHTRKSGHGWTPETPGIETTFLASGRGIRRGVRLPRVRLVDVAPTVAALLGISLGETDGTPIVSVLAE
jgi:predicted AlkP superfamily pyrophosphatase or phosphodiesterase